MSRIFRVLVLSVFVTTSFLTLSAKAMPVTAEQKAKNPQFPSLRDQMDKMILSVADLDILINRNDTIDYDIFTEDAERILEAIGKIRELDTTKLFAKPLKDLEAPTKKLLKLAKKKDPNINKAANQVFQACFQCHQAHRKDPLQ